MSLLIDYAHMQNRALDAKKAGNMLEVDPDVILSMVDLALLTANRLETMTNDRDAEKRMKATARGQRDKMTKKYSELVKLLESTGVLQLDQEWAVEIQNLIKEHKTR